MNLDDEELKATRKIYYSKSEGKFYKDKMSLEKALNILEHKEDYLIPNSDIYEAVDILIEHIKGKYDI